MRPEGIVAPFFQRLRRHHIHMPVDQQTLPARRRPSLQHSRYNRAVLKALSRFREIGARAHFIVIRLPRVNVHADLRHDADHFLLHRDRFSVALDGRNLVIWLIGFILYRLLMYVDIPVGYTLVDMLITAALCVAADRLFRST